VADAVRKAVENTIAGNKRFEIDDWPRMCAAPPARRWMLGQEAVPLCW